MTFVKHLALGAALAIPSLLPAYAADPAPRRAVVGYEDLTGTQPLSSAPFVSHVDGLYLWKIGKPVGRVTLTPPQPAS